MVNTLTKFGVPLGGGAGRGGILQPKHRSRFRVRVINFGPIAGGTEFSQQVMSADRPKIDMDEIQLDSYNSRAWVAGKHTWTEINIMLRDDVTNSVSRLVGAQVQKQMNHFEQTAPLAAINYKFTTFLEIMDGGNDSVLEMWTLEGCWLKNVSYEAMDYAAGGDIMQISLSVRYDNATQGDGLFPLLPQLLLGVQAAG